MAWLVGLIGYGSGDVVDILDLQGDIINQNLSAHHW